MLIATPTIARISDASQLIALRDEWNRLAGSVPFRRWEWLASWWKHYATPTDELLVLTARLADGELVGLAPWHISRSLRYGRVVRFLGGGEVCSDHLSVLAAPGHEHSVVEALATWLTQSADSQWDLLDFAAIDVDDAIIPQLVEKLVEQRHRSHQRPGLSSWAIELPDTWATYLTTLNHGRRDKVRRMERKVFGAGRAMVKDAATPAEFERGWEILVDLHQRRWQHVGLPGCFASRRLHDLHYEVAKEFLAEGTLHLQWIELDGQPVAAAYGFIGGETLYLYQTGYDPEAAREKPGWLQTIATLKTTLDRGQRRIDLLRGDEAYKASWRAIARPAVDYRVVARQPAAQLRHAVWLVERRLKAWAKEGWRWVRPVGRSMPVAGKQTMQLEYDPANV